MRVEGDIIVLVDDVVKKYPDVFAERVEVLVHWHAGVYENVTEILRVILWAHNLLESIHYYRG